MLLDQDPAHAFLPYPAVAVPSAPEGPLAGLTLAVKDLFDVAGYPTGCGSPHKLALSGPKNETAPAVRRMLDAGARFVGKTHTDELAFSLNGRNAHWGTPVNGAAPDRIPGGSSSGSASAVSNGLADLALGTDTGGSVRAPASHCGLWGLRPTHGRVSLEGCMALAPSLDTGGLFARDREVFARAAAVLLGDDAGEAPARPRLLLAADAFTMLDRDVREALAPCVAAIEAEWGRAALVEIAPKGFEPLYWAFRRLQGREAWLAQGPFVERHAPALGPGVAERFAYARGVTVDECETSRIVQGDTRARLRDLLGRDGLLLLPTMPDVAPRLSQSEAELDAYRNAAINLLCPAGLAGLPQLSMPLMTRDGAPLGLSLIGPADRDLWLVRTAADLAARLGPSGPGVR